MIDRANAKKEYAPGFPLYLPAIFVFTIFFFHTIWVHYQDTDNTDMKWIFLN